MKWHFEKLDRANSVGEIYHLYRRIIRERGVYGNWYGRKLVSRETSFHNYQFFFSFFFFCAGEIKTGNGEEHSPSLKKRKHDNILAMILWIMCAEEKILSIYFYSLYLKGKSIFSGIFNLTCVLFDFGNLNFCAKCSFYIYARHVLK